MKRVSGKDMCRALERLGWTLVRTRGSHHIYKQPGNPVLINVPVHGHQTLKLGTQHGIMRDAELTDHDL